MIKKRFAIFWPQSLTAQLVLVLIAALICAQIISFFILADERIKSVVIAERVQIAERTASLVKILNTLPEERWHDAVRASSSRGFKSSLSSDPQVTRTDRQQNRFSKIVTRRLKKQGISDVRIEVEDASFFHQWAFGDFDGDRDRFRGFFDDHEKHGHRSAKWHKTSLLLSLKVADGRWLNIEQRLRPPAIWLPGSGTVFWLTCLIVSLFGYLVLRRVIQPLKALAVAAEQFGRGEQAEPLAENGPREVAKASRAFNQMRERIGRFVKDRTTMLAAINHDLRTPITSLRLRAEFIEEAEVREKMLETLDDMSAMVEESLSFAREEAGHANVSKINLTALLESMSDDQADLGHEVAFQGSDTAVVMASTSGLKRAFGNLIGNALRYGGKAEITLHRGSGVCNVWIDDRGPGLAADELERVFEPFFRVDQSRNREMAGTGLGLAIARSLIRKFGGDITLQNRKDGGLRAIVHLPLV